LECRPWWVAKKGAGTVFATDAMVAAIMCTARSVYGWDLVVTKQDGKIFLDRRDDSNFDLLTVSETAQDPISDEKDNINGEAASGNSCLLAFIQPQGSHMVGINPAPSTVTGMSSSIEPQGTRMVSIQPTPTTTTGPA